MKVSPQIPLAYLITFTCYGTRLHGHKSGSVDRRHNAPGSPFLRGEPQKSSGENPAVKRGAPRTESTRTRIDPGSDQIGVHEPGLERARGSRANDARAYRGRGTRNPRKDHDCREGLRKPCAERPPGKRNAKMVDSPREHALPVEEGARQCGYSLCCGGAGREPTADGIFLIIRDYSNGLSVKRPYRNRFLTTNSTLAGRSASLLMKYENHSCPYGI